MKKLIAVLLAMLFITLIVAGCGDSPKRDDDKARQTEKAETEAKTEAGERC